MDFGTICRNLESGVKYMNSEDVYKDVQYIWNNCYKYNNKGDYVMDLMKRVKKNFAKYWTAAGLYSDHLQSKSLLYLNILSYQYQSVEFAYMFFFFFCKSSNKALVIIFAY